MRSKQQIAETADQDKRPFQIRIREQRRKSIRLNIVSETVLELIAPIGFTEKQAEKLVDKHLARIEKLFERYRETQQKIDYQDGTEIMYLGKPLAIQFVTETDKLWKLEDKLLIDAKYKAQTKEVLRSFYETKAVLIYNRCITLAQLHGFQPSKISLRHNLKRWGSCSTAKTINLNIRLIMAPQEVIDYIIIHELAHLQHHDHSRQFWDFVGKLIPDYRIHKQWLKLQGHKLIIPGYK